MPKRTNLFQQVVFLIQRQLAKGATVTESKMLTSKSTGVETEVDIVVDAVVADINLTIGIECTAEKRPASVEWVREMFGKHSDLPIHRSILVAKSGFTRQARMFAESRGVLTLTMKEAKDLDWKATLGDLQSLNIGSFELMPLGGTVQYDETKLAGEARFDVDEKSRVVSGDGSPPISWGEYLRGILGDKRVFLSVTRKWLGIPAEKRQNMFEFAVELETHDSNMSLVSPNGTPCPIRKVTLKARAKVVDTPLRLEAATFKGKSVAHGSARNIFAGSSDPTRDVVVTLVRDGTQTTGSVLIPGYKGDAAKAFDMKFVEGEELKDKKSWPSIP